MTSVVIAAHNEEHVIGACLDALLGRQGPEPIGIVVSANGCTDRTAAAATRPGVTVIDRAEAGKTAALNAADEVATGFPRIYLDADIVVPPGGIAAILACFDASPRSLAVVPRRRLNTAGRPWPVRAYFSINERMSPFRNGLFGRGMIALSEQGRARFDVFPAVIADDLFVDSQFSDAEKAEASEIEVVVEAPFTTSDLLRRLVRVRRGNRQLRASAEAGRIAAQVRPVDHWGWLRDAVVPEPRLASAAIPYLIITVMAALLARRPVKAGREWGRDESTRGPRRPGEEVGST
ncbi:glycosyltransferase family 2 protein [Agromyces cerinus]|uniref:4,4'-diaponeurosporenoate glycosyltransferase n=1 Tax=Agromyces cerinus subsp. cerinus TaxID=232089 RepID=A0A1N6F6A8_9MICO|nr:glycosyltransferase [Agromyces cerinus]SIN90790.1 Glycosyltransferase involved in cell wall bisynthesis [Agromyces cerinus subsp. cerinus]